MILPKFVSQCDFSSVFSFATKPGVNDTNKFSLSMMLWKTVVCKYFNTSSIIVGKIDAENFLANSISQVSFPLQQNLESVTLLNFHYHWSFKKQLFASILSIIHSWVTRIMKCINQFNVSSVLSFVTKPGVNDTNKFSSSLKAFVKRLFANILSIVQHL